MEGTERRTKILELLETEKEPVSGTALAKRFGVSRQIIVQDIALLRATNRNIISTNKGYMIYGNQAGKKCRRILAVKHSNEQTREELYLIADLGGTVLDVIVEHDVYGQITADLMLSSRKDVDEFMNRLLGSQSRPLKVLTEDVHYHTVEADSEEILDAIVRTLKEKGYLLDFAK